MGKMRFKRTNIVFIPAVITEVNEDEDLMSYDVEFLPECTFVNEDGDPFERPSLTFFKEELESLAREGKIALR